MHARCTNSLRDNYDRYGGKGISVCEEWKEYEVFEKWALSNGFSDDLQIDRINGDGNYEPSNCRFVKPKVNNRNKENNLLTMPKASLMRSLYSTGLIKQWKIAELFGTSKQTVSDVVTLKTWYR